MWGNSGLAAVGHLWDEALTLSPITGWREAAHELGWGQVLPRCCPSGHRRREKLLSPALQLCCWGIVVGKQVRARQQLWGCMERAWPRALRVPTAPLCPRRRPGGDASPATAKPQKQSFIGRGAAQSPQPREAPGLGAVLEAAEVSPGPTGPGEPGSKELLSLCLSPAPAGSGTARASG